MCRHRNPRLGRLGSDSSPPGRDGKTQRGLALSSAASLEANLCQQPRVGEGWRGMAKGQQCPCAMRKERSISWALGKVGGSTFVLFLCFQTKRLRPREKGLAQGHSENKPQN